MKNLSFNLISNRERMLMLRLRVRRTDWPRPALILTDTPRPRCPDCRGEGGHEHTSVTAYGEFDGTDWYPCPCWDEARRWLLLPLPRLPLRWRRDRHLYSDEPPF